MGRSDRSLWIAEAEADDAIRVILLRGAGDKAFSTGADISEFDTVREGDAALEYDALNQAAFDAVSGAGKPVIAMIQGFCLGGGLALALCCDLRVAAEGAQFSIPAAKLGLGYHPRWIKPLLACVSPRAPRSWSSLDHDDFGLVQSKIMNSDLSL